MCIELLGFLPEVLGGCSAVGDEGVLIEGRDERTVDESFQLLRVGFKREMKTQVVIVFSELLIEVIGIGWIELAEMEED